MGWANDLHDASFRGVRFDVTSTRDSSAKSLAIHQAPYANDALIDDMGNDAKHLSVDAIFTGDDYLIRLNALTAALDAYGPGELMHPIYGTLTVQVRDYSVYHDADTVDFASVSIQFIQAKSSKPDLFTPVQVTKLPLDVLLEQAAEALEQDLAAIQIADKNRFFNVLNRVRNAIQDVRQRLNLAISTVDQVLSPQSWAVGLLDDVRALVRADVSISAFARWRDLFYRVERYGSLFSNDDNPFDSVPSLMQFDSAVQVATALATTQIVIDIVQEELSSTQPISTRMTPLDLAQIRKETRELLQAAIAAERESGDQTGHSVAMIQLYKQLADQVHMQIQTLIEARPPLSTYTVKAPCTYHWLAHHLYGDLSRADEIQHLNPTLENPALLMPGVEVVVYAQ